MSIISGATILVIVFGGVVCNIRNCKKRQEEDKKRKEEFNELLKIWMESSEKRCEKIRFILDLIDEIPELSYYEAAQLKKKVSIYLQWNDE